MEKPSPAPSPPQRSRPGRRRTARYVPYRRLRERAARLTVTERATHTHISPLVQAGDGPLRLPDLAPAMAADEDRRSPPICDIFCGNGSSDTIQRAVESGRVAPGGQPCDRHLFCALSRLRKPKAAVRPNHRPNHQRASCPPISSISTRRRKCRQARCKWALS